VPDSADPEGRLILQVQALEQAVTSLIEDARTRPGAAGSCDAADVLAQRAAFLVGACGRPGQGHARRTGGGGRCWSAWLSLNLPPALTPCSAMCSRIPHKTRTSRCGCRRGPVGGAFLSVEDTGPGFTDADVIRRGASGGHSTGLGIDIARQAAEVSGGSLTIKAGNRGHVVLEFGPPRPLGPP